MVGGLVLSKNNIKIIIMILIVYIPDLAAAVPVTSRDLLEADAVGRVVPLVT